MGETSLFDFEYINAALEELQEYLVSDKLFWPLRGHAFSGSQAFSQLTLGGILLALARSRARAITPESAVKVDSLESNVDVIRDQWQAAWRDKTNWEFRSRLRQWGNYMDEIQRDLQEFGAYYNNEVRIRSVLSLLSGQTNRIDEGDMSNLNKLDQRLYAQFVPGDFIWEEGLRGGFPKKEYWFLWGNLRK